MWIRHRAIRSTIAKWAKCWWSMAPWPVRMLGAEDCHGVSASEDFREFVLNGYGSIPINTIFRGMNIHLPAILMWTTGVLGFDTLPNHRSERESSFHDFHGQIPMNTMNFSSNLGITWHQDIVTDLGLGVASGSGRATTTWDVFLEARPQWRILKMKNAPTNFDMENIWSCIQETSRNIQKTETD